MFHYFPELENRKSEKDILEGAVQVARRLGFDFFAYGIRSLTPVTRPKTALFNNYPSQWTEIYKQNGYLSIDPTVSHAFQSNLPLLWSEHLFKSAPLFWEEANRFGLRHGWSQASRDSTGTVGLVTLARGHEIISQKESSHIQPLLTMLTQMTHELMYEAVAPKLIPERSVALTPREVEILKWTAEGKTSHEIGMILKITERTVNFHVNNCLMKLHSQNKVQAVVKASMLGLLI